jgi:hypothetical protein
VAFNTIQYGTYSFPFCSLHVAAATVYAEDKMTKEETSYTFSVSGYLTGTTETDFNNQLTAMKCQLNTPRKAFQVRWSPDGISWENLYDYDPVNEDVAWGPQPGELTLEKFSGGKAALYRWTCSVRVAECYNNSCAPYNRPTNVLSIVRRYRHSVDENGLTTRTVSGKLTVSSSSVANNAPADSYRLLVVPALPVNFKRTQQDLDQSADGRELTFSFTDVEALWTLPQPISKGQASWSVRVSDMGARIDYVLSGRFEAPATVSKATIVDRIALLAANRFPIASGGGLIFESRDLTEEVYANSVSFHLTAWGLAGSTRAATRSTG